MVELEVSLRDQSLEPVQGVKAIEEFIGMLVIDNDLKKKCGVSRQFQL